MVQAQIQQKRRQRGDDAEARFQRVVSEVRALPPTMLADLLHEIADLMRGQVKRNGQRNPRNDSDVAELATTGIEARRDQTNGSGAAADEADDEPMSGYDLVIAQGGPMAEVARMLKRGNLSEEERQQMKELAYEAVVSMPPPIEPPPTDEEVKQMLHEHLMEKYGRDIKGFKNAGITLYTPAQLVKRLRLL
jgi:hypothetical protein